MGETILDPRIRRTRELLQESLCKLLKKQEFEKISVQDIAEAATLNRATFYDHFPDKFALLEYMIGTRFHQMIAERELQFDGTCTAALQSIVLAVCDFVSRLQQSHAKGQFEPRMEMAIIHVVRAKLLEGLTLHPPAHNVSAELVAGAASWAIYGAAREWAQTAERAPAAEIADAVTRLVAPVLGLPCDVR